jgi:hypothetical protein
VAMALEIVKRAAAIDTGAIEGLYDTDRGFTFTVACQMAQWEAALEKKGPRVRALFESQLSAYEYVLDFAVQSVPIAEAWIRRLHEEICKTQDTYTAYTEIGLQELQLPKGDYKHLPNHVRTKDGQIHSYAPVYLTASEMHRLCEELRNDAFLASHPVLQASYAHYGLVAIHPFADGNGRVARALASVYTYRSHSIPLLILADTRREYHSSLESADNANYQPFVDFILERTLDGIRLVNESLRAAAAPQPADVLTLIKSLYMTKGGYSQAQVDEAGYKLFDLFLQEISRKAPEHSIPGLLSYSLSNPNTPHSPLKATYHLPVTAAPKSLTIVFSSAGPANAVVSRTFGLEVPVDCGLDDDLIIQCLEKREPFEARMTEITPVVSASLQMRLAMWVDKTLGELLDELYRTAQGSFER